MHRKGVSIIFGVLAGTVLAVSSLIGSAQASEPVLRQATPWQEAPPTPEASLYLPLISEPFRTYLPLVNGLSAIHTPHPANDATRQSLNAYLTWVASDPRLQGATYTVYLERDDATPDEAVATGLTTTALDPSTFEEDARYYWQVVATSSAGQQIDSPIWTFTTDFFPDTPETAAMVEVTAGTFLMGCDPNHNGGYLCSSEDTPLHEVYLDAYRIDKYEVTNQEYRACVAAGACNLPRKFGSETRASYFYNAQYDYYPVVYVSHWDAQDFCAWEGKRLPTEAEWEKSARGAIDTRPFPWGEEPFDCTWANHRYTSPSDTTRVDDFRNGQSPYGLMNISGNVWEWVQDYYYDYYYTITPYANPVLTVSMQDPNIPYFSVRGGCFRHAWWYLRTSHRKGGHWGDTIFEGSNDKPLFRSSIYGFRCAQSISDD